MFERKHEKPLSRVAFLKRMCLAVGLAVAVILTVLGFGIAGYHWLDELTWIDSLVEASMILGGMGPVNPLRNNAAKFFASGYALFSGLVFIGVMGIILTPLVHRILHKFHFDE